MTSLHVTSSFHTNVSSFCCPIHCYLLRVHWERQFTYFSSCICTFIATKLQKKNIALSLSLHFTLVRGDQYSFRSLSLLLIFILLCAVFSSFLSSHQPSPSMRCIPPVKWCICQRQCVSSELTRSWCHPQLPHRIEIGGMMHRVERQSLKTRFASQADSMEIENCSKRRRLHRNVY